MRQCAFVQFGLGTSFEDGYVIIGGASLGHALVREVRQLYELLQQGFFKCLMLLFQCFGTLFQCGSIGFGGFCLGFLLADMAAAVSSARATYLDAARRRDQGRPYSQQASVAKLVATDAAMKVTTDAVQVLGGVGYTRDFRVERYMREAKITQIFEGTNQIQRLVIARSLTT